MAICLEKADILAFRLCCCLFLNAVLIVCVSFPFGVWAGFEIRLYAFQIIAFSSLLQLKLRHLLNIQEPEEKVMCYDVNGWHLY